MPNQARTIARNVRIHDTVWEAAKARADAEGTTVSAVIVKALERYARTKTPREPRAPWGTHTGRRQAEEAPAD